MDWWQYVVAILGGFLAGIINTLAGNGSVITLTILTEVLGLPGNLANGTNRIGVFAQTSVGAWSFYRNGKLPFRRTRYYILISVIGAILGVLIATRISNDQFRSIFSYLLVLMLVVILVKPQRWLRETDLNSQLPWYLSTPLFLAIGFYGGFIQMGMGIFFLAVMVLCARFSLTESNAVKLLVVGIYTALVIAIFAWNGLIDWRIGGIIAIGQFAGGWLTAEFASNNAHANIWAHRLLIIMVSLAVIKLFFTG
ncbi:MAG: sulfite exporter TauE/SafE family protein [Saprospiraceae bacterium]|nr:sulfite exporter TauE/SafE family protein [Saprospiraceae bacterium]